MEKGKERQRGEQIKHRFHKHPLVFVDEEQTSQSKRAYCSGCREVVSGPRFSCAECKYLLHQRCAEAPDKIEHPLHRQDCDLRHLYLLGGPQLFLHESPMGKGFVCALCMEKHDLFFYGCGYCLFFLDINCALSSHNLDENCHEFKHDVHQHSLIFIENHKDELKRGDCSLCRQPLIDAVYICLPFPEPRYKFRPCQFRLHKKCLDDLSTEINHPSHRHPLVLKFNNDDPFCKPCQKKHHGSFYCCSPCNFNINIECAWPRPIILQDKSHHQHPFTLLWRLGSFICDACGIEGNYICYICSTCNIMVHKECTSLPRIIKVTRHDHAIFHHYFLQKQELEKQDCNICFNVVKPDCGSYYCLKQDCNYIVHVNCAIGNDDLYSIVDEENQDEEPDENLAKSISVIEVNEVGEATKIKHFKHDHDLMLKDKMEEDGNRQCDGCMLSISTPFYYCSQCDFLLHKTCAELPKNKHHWFHRFVTNLGSSKLFECYLCGRDCGGFLYQSGNLWFCLRCATIPYMIESQGHKHFLFFDYECKGQCNACGVSSRRGAYRCKECPFALDFACLTLPQGIQHKCDEHLLKLTYHDENDGPEQHYCDICEEKRDPNHWYYYCTTCDNSIHPERGLGKYPFVKNRITYDWYPIHSRRLMNLLNAMVVVSFAKIKVSSVLNATIFCTSNVRNFNSELYNFLVRKGTYMTCQGKGTS